VNIPNTVDIVNIYAHVIRSNLAERYSIIIKYNV
jgi:hypothetical protein